MRRAAWVGEVAGVLAAFGASLCCVGPLLFAMLGVGAGLASTFEPLRPLFTAFGVLGLGVGFYTVYRRPSEADACVVDRASTRPRSRRRDMILLWSATLLALLLWSFPSWSFLLL